MRSTSPAASNLATPYESAGPACVVPAWPRSARHRSCRGALGGSHRGPSLHPLPRRDRPRRPRRRRRLLGTELERLAAAGADVAPLAAKHATHRPPHAPGTECDAAHEHRRRHLRRGPRLGLRRVGLLGPRFTMESNFYTDVFAPASIGIVVPTPITAPAAPRVHRRTRPRRRSAGDVGRADHRR